MDFVVKYWVQFVFGLLITYGTYLFRNLKKYQRQLQAIKKTVVHLAKTELISLYERMKDKEVISIREKENFTELYCEYTKFEECDIISDIMKDINEKKIG